MTPAEIRPPAPQGIPGPARAALLLSLALGVVTGASGAALPLLRDAYRLADGSGVELVVLYNLGAFLALLALGGGRARAATGTVLTALTYLFAAAAGGMALAVWTASSTGWPLLLALATAAGFGFGGLILLLNSYVGEHFGARRVTMLNLLHACFGAGAVVGPLMLAAGVGVAPVLGAAGAVAALCLPVRGAVLAPRPPAGAGPATGRPALPLLAAFALASLVYAGLEVSVAALASTHLTELGHDAARAAGLTGLFWAGLTLGRLVLPALARGWSDSRLALTGVLAGAGALASTVLPGWAPAGYALAGLGLSVVFPTLLAWAFGVLGDGQRVASVLLIANLAGSIALPGAVAAAGATGRAGIPVALTVLALVTAAAVAAPLRLLARPAAVHPHSSPERTPAP